MIGTKITKEEYKKDSSFYTQCASWCNKNNAHIEDKGTYFEIVANALPTLQQQLETKEAQYNMCRWQREMILASSSGASDYNKAKAQELEDIAEQIRNQNGGQNE